MRSPDSILVFSLGIHFPISLTFAEYKDLVDSAAVMFTRLAGSPGFPATVIWKSTAAFEKQKVTMVPWPGKQLNSTMLRFMTTQQVCPKYNVYGWNTCVRCVSADRFVRKWDGGLRALRRPSVFSRRDGY
ncbi:predicted protein [Nematostella vectensis]|uniref:Uncharacterized protein n=1 Tax=Nematostella vectensis TaxID=45351 RepID=A7REZ5_NEMVE|nr:predicted protein [Nematostella vectensis]|eukprot:XP_001642060.1 predicted protein [Nematostella vectensis]